MGFLLFNVCPASVFMGDTGSLALGGFVAATAYMLDAAVYVIRTVIYLVEVVSVILQVGYFKLTHGKRFSRWRRFTIIGKVSEWSEPRIVAVFSIIITLLCMMGLVAI